MLQSEKCSVHPLWITGHFRPLIFCFEDALARQVGVVSFNEKNVASRIEPTSTKLLWSPLEPQLELHSRVPSGETNLVVNVVIVAVLVGGRDVVAAFGVDRLPVKPEEGERPVVLRR